MSRYDYQWLKILKAAAKIKGRPKGIGQVGEIHKKKKGN